MARFCVYFRSISAALRKRSMALSQSWSLAACEPSRAIFAASGLPSCWADCAVESPSVITRHRANNVFMVSDVDDQLDRTIQNWRSQFLGELSLAKSVPDSAIVRCLPLVRARSMLGRVRAHPPE